MDAGGWGAVVLKGREAVIPKAEVVRGGKGGQRADGWEGAWGGSVGVVPGLVGE